ncbi:MFS transporter [Pseudofrankia sp. EUN1h]|uniref:MFS transporter n=1 Tax=Pseudofrankia sp. EUN1h TaxID=1834515 RepID=UPI0008DAD00C|nr:MFS transporter [Pseudofrankia sp. EUN1h]OHV39021.1 hypothetical protein BCD49_11930 [Pseudofrankia sp. EUN1h]
MSLLQQNVALIDETKPEKRNRGLSRQFWALWAADGVSAVGSQVTLVALPLTAVTYLNASPGAVGLLRAAGFAPVIVLALVAGALLDRRSSATVLRWSSWGQAALIGVVPLAAALHVLTIWPLVVIALLVSSLAVFAALASQSTLPETVDVDQLTTANARLTFLRGLAETAGPAMAGFLVVALTAPTAMSVDAVSFAAAALILLGVRTARRPPATGTGTGTGTAAGSLGIAEGARFLLRHPMLRRVAIAGGTLNLFSGVGAALQVIFLARELRLSAAFIGLLFAVQGLAGIATSLLVGRLTRWTGLGWALVLGLVAEGAGALLFSLAAGPHWLILVTAGTGMAVGAMVVPLYNVNHISLRQAIVPRELLGRVNACARTIVMGTLPVGSLLGGLLAATLGTRPVLVAAAVCMLAAGGWLATTGVPAVRTVADARRLV